MPGGTGIVVVRQAGSAAGIVPAAEELLSGKPMCCLVLIAFPQAVPTCHEVARNLERFAFHAVATEEEARDVFSRHINQSAFVVTGTSEAATADAYYWRTARACGVPAIAYLDQWSNIEARFPGSGREDWPDQLAVIDAYDRALALAIAPPGVEIRVTGSPALERIKREVANLHEQGVSAERNRLVFATEPVANIREYRAINGFCDEDSFRLALEVIRLHHSGSSLVMRLHPRDSRERWIGLLPIDIHVEWDMQTRSVCLARAERVFGMRSFFLLEALACGVPVVSFQPNKKTYCALTDERMLVVSNIEDYRL